MFEDRSLNNLTLERITVDSVAVFQTQFELEVDANQSIHATLHQVVRLKNVLEQLEYQICHSYLPERRSSCCEY